MIPASFDYVRPSSLDEAVTALRDAGEDAKVLAGGQSLLPLLRLRLAYPEVLVDLGAAAGAARRPRRRRRRWSSARMTTHDEVMRDPLVREHAPLLAAATATVADPPYATGARSAAPWRTPTRPATCRPWRSRWTRCS